MNRNTVGELNFREFAFGIFDDVASELDRHARAVRGNAANDAHIAIKDVFVVVIAGLDNFVADAKGAAAVEDFSGQRLACFFAKMGLFGGRVVGVGTEFGFSGGLWVEALLDLGVEHGDAAGAAVHGRHDLNVANGVNLVVLGDVIAGQIQNCLDALLWSVGFDETEVFAGIEVAEAAEG